MSCYNTTIFLQKIVRFIAMTFGGKSSDILFLYFQHAQASVSVVGSQEYRITGATLFKQG